MSVMIKDSELVYFFAIREGTRNEYLSAGSDGRVVRWAADGPNGIPSDKQRWFISAKPHFGAGPAPSETRYRIQNVGTGGFLHVGAGGFYWTDRNNSSEDEATFSVELTNHASGGFGLGPFPCWINIREHTRNEFVAIGGNGWGVRWGNSGNEDQRFYLERYGAPASLAGLPTIHSLPVLEPQQSEEPDFIPAPPMLTADASTAKPGPQFLVAEQVLPSALVRDPRYNDPLAQASVSPWYRFRHIQQYDILRGTPQPGVAHVSGRARFTYQISARRLLRKEDITTLTDTFAWNISGEVTGELAAQKGESDKQHTKGGGTAKLAFSVSKTLEHMTSNGTIDENEAIVFKEVSFEPQKEDWSLATYGLLNIFVLIDSGGNVIQRWEVFDTDRLVMRGWPLLPQHDVAVA